MVFCLYGNAFFSGHAAYARIFKGEHDFADRLPVHHRVGVGEHDDRGIHQFHPPVHGGGFPCRSGWKKTVAFPSQRVRRRSFVPSSLPSVTHTMCSFSSG